MRSDKRSVSTTRVHGPSWRPWTRVVETDLKGSISFIVPGKKQFEWKFRKIQSISAHILRLFLARWFDRDRWWHLYRDSNVDGLRHSNRLPAQEENSKVHWSELNRPQHWRDYKPGWCRIMQERKIKLIFRNFNENWLISTAAMQENKRSFMNTIYITKGPFRP